MDYDKGFNMRAYIFCKLLDGLWCMFSLFNRKIVSTTYPDADFKGCLRRLLMARKGYEYLAPLCLRNLFKGFNNRIAGFYDLADIDLGFCESFAVRMKLASLGEDVAFPESLEFEGLKDFTKKVLSLVKAVPRGFVVSYSQIAKALGMDRASRAVGAAVKKNPYPLIIPCHRVVLANGEIGGFSYGREAKLKLLSREGVVIKEGVVDDKCFWRLGGFID